MLGVLLVNTGTPDAPRSAQVRDFLRRFLSDPRVVELPRLPWLLLLNGLILPLRSPRSARKYRSIWMDGGSPLAVHSEQLRAALEQELEARCAGDVAVEHGFLYSRPLLPQALQKLRDAGATRIVAVPLYPQASGSTTGAVFDQLGLAARAWRAFPDLRIIGDYHANAGYIRALANSVREHWNRHGRSQQLLMSFHGIPQSYVAAGDAYERQCRATAAQLAAALELRADEWLPSFQSRFGSARWLEPATSTLLHELPGRGVRDLAVICPGFAVDCLETLEEISQEGRADFLAAGGQSYQYVPALNARLDHAQALADLILTPGD
ncbi:MAG: ferrochelatase [Steroidobacteraceae bacterium]